MKIRHGIIGTGGMAQQHVLKMNEIDQVSVTAGCDINHERASAFCKKNDIPNVYTSVEQMLADDVLDSVSITTPDPFHAELAIQALEAGKHVLCEKPLATNYPDALRMVAAAEKAQKINMVNLSYREAPAIQKAREMALAGDLGEIRHVHAHYLQGWLQQDSWGYWKESPQWLWRLSSKHGSKGVLGDLGVHILDFASYPVDDYKSVHCTFKTFDKAPNNQIGDYTFDVNDTAIITAEFMNGAMGTIHTTRAAAPHRNSLRLNIYGDLGAIEVDLDRSRNTLEFCATKERVSGDYQTIECGEETSNYEQFITAIRTGTQLQPDFKRGAAIQKVLDACEVSAAEDRTIQL